MGVNITPSIIQNKEIWKDIIGYKGLYKISNYGKIISMPKMCGGSFREKRLKKFGIDKDGYCMVSLSDNNKQKTYKVHRLVMLHFLKKYNNKLQTNHINGIKQDNRLSNLEMCTCSENIKHAIKNNLRGIGNTKKIIIINLKDNKEYLFKTQKEASLFIGMSKNHIAFKKYELKSNEFITKHYLVKEYEKT